MDIICYNANKISEDYMFARHDCVIKPNVGDNIIFRNKFYKVIGVAIDYKNNTVHAFVEELKSKKKFWT